jgi:hypothetical protein
MIVLTVLRNVALCLLSISSAGGHSADGRRHAPLGGELINILPPLEAVDLNTVAAALETYVNVTAQLQEMDAWKHYRRARDFMRQHRTQLDAGISSRAPAPAAGVSASEERGGRKKKEVVHLFLQTLTHRLKKEVDDLFLQKKKSRRWIEA